ncbi:unnamed protein product, partial [Symbiodinium sp. CCMP2592]
AVKIEKLSKSAIEERLPGWGSHSPDKCWWKSMVRDWEKHNYGDDDKKDADRKRKENPSQPDPNWGKEGMKKRAKDDAVIKVDDEPGEETKSLEENKGADSSKDHEKKKEEKTKDEKKKDDRKKDDKKKDEQKKDEKKKDDKKKEKKEDKKRAESPEKRDREKGPENLE